jgi:hypothetical protein
MILFHHQRPTRICPTIVAMGLAFLLTSCGGGGPKLYPVRGKVLFENQPAEGGTVVFHPAGGNAKSPKPGGVVAADGSFTLHTYPHGEGAPAGDYGVVVTWFPPDARGQENPKNKLPARYADPAQSELNATVKPQSNELEPFRLTR